MRAVALSDPQVVARIDASFVPLMLNLSDQEFPDELRGLALWKKAYQGDWRFTKGFATSVVLEPTGKGPLGTSGCGHTWELDTSINYDPAKYRAFLDGCLDRHARAQKIYAMPPGPERNRLGLALRDEVVAQLREANRCRRPQDE